MDLGLSGAVVVVTGGMSGIGAATVEMFTSAGATAVALDRETGPGNAVLADVTNGPSVKSAVEAIVERFGGIDVLVNCAGVGAIGSVEVTPDEEWARILDVNVVGIARVTRACLPYLRQSRRACVVNVSSIAATAGLPERAAYSASKGAVSALTRAMAADHISDGIRVNAVNPGTAKTPWVDRLLEQSSDPEETLRRLNNRQPMGRLVAAQEVAAAVVFLAGPLSGATTGTELAVDGGMSGLRIPARP